MIAASIVAVVGGIATLVGSAWLMFIDPPTDDGMLYPGQQTSKAVPELLWRQRRPSALIAAGAAVQLAGAIIALTFALQQ